MSGLSFTHPWLLLLAVLPLVLPWLERMPGLRRLGKVSFSGFDWAPSVGSGRSGTRDATMALRIVAMLCLVPVAMGLGGKAIVTVPAPQALIVVLDVSSSMTADDFSPGSRLEAAKQLLSETIDENQHADIGLVLLAASPKLAVAATPEHEAFRTALDEVHPAAFGEDGTAIGSGIASAVNRLRAGPWKTRRILLVTDGVNNRGALAPADAASIAAEFGIRVDAIGIGTGSVSRFWVPSAQGNPVEVEARIEIDDDALEEVAGIAGGRYFRVTSSDELRSALSHAIRSTEAPPPEQSVLPDFTWVQLLAGMTVLLIWIELAWTGFLFPELPG